MKVDIKQKIKDEGGQKKIKANRGIRANVCRKIKRKCQRNSVTNTGINEK